MTRPNPSLRKLYGLQYLRALAAVAVTLTHAAGAGNYRLAIGNAGVDLFFVLSGFLMIAITDERTRPGPFMADRILRIAPPYWLATSVLFIGGLLGLFPNLRLTLGHVAGSYLFMPVRSPSNATMIAPLLVPGWTLIYEMAFYAVFAGLLLMGSQRRQVVALTMIFGALTIIGRLVPSGHAGFLFYTNAIVLEFAAGAWLGLAWKHRGNWLERARYGLLVAGIAGLVVAAAAGTPVERTIAWGIPALLIVAGVLGLERHRPIGRWRLPLFLGDASYSIYLWHTLAISVGHKVTERLHLTGLWAATLCAAAGLLVGLVAHVLIERPILAFFHRRRYARGVPVPAGI